MRKFLKVLFWGFVFLLFFTIINQGIELSEQIDELNAKLTIHYNELQNMKAD